MIADIGNEITNSLPMTGVKAMGANLPMGGNRVTGMADPTQSTDGATKNYVDTAAPAGTVNHFTAGTSTGAAGAQVLATTTPNTFTLTTGYKITFPPGFTNVTTMTLQVGALAAKNVFKRSSAGPVALVGGEVVAAQMTTVVYDGTQFVLDEQAILTSPTIVTPTLTMKNSAAPVPTAQGDLQWDNANFRFVVGNGTAQTTFSGNPATTVDQTVPRYTGTAGTFNTSGVTIDNTNKLTAPGGLAGASGTIPFQKLFESAQQTITSAGSLTIAHGLGVQPKNYAAFIQCITAELGYSVGQELPLTMEYGGTLAGVMAIVPDATNLNIRFGNSNPFIGAINFTTGAEGNLTNANWKLVVRAWA